MLDRAQGVLIALRRCTVDAAFEEIGRASMRHQVAQVRIAAALVTLTQDSPLDVDAMGRRPLRVGLAVRAGEPVIERIMAFARWVRARYPD